MNFNNIPRELQELPQWAVFRIYTDNKGKRKKVIISPVNNEFAKCNEPATWTDFNRAKQYCLKNRYAGLTFALTKGITFIDIDHAIDKDTGEILSEEAKRLLELFPDTYIEKSVSGTGIHILVKGALPENARNRNDKKGLEMYDANRFICMTGDLLSDTTALKDCSDKIKEINYTFIGARAEPVICIRSTHEWSPSDSELIEKIRSSKVGRRFDELYGGGFGNCNDHSSADYAFVSLLAWWTQDTVQLDRIFRCSGLYRPKWDSLRGNSTYGARLIESVLSELKSTYTPKTTPKAVRVTVATEM